MPLALPRAFAPALRRSDPDAAPSAGAVTLAISEYAGAPGGAP